MRVSILVFFIVFLYGQGSYFRIRSEKALECYRIALKELRFEYFRHALEKSEEALFIEPTFAEAWNIKGFCLYMLNRYEEAIEAFEKARVYVDEDLPYIYFYLADCYYKIGEYEKSYQNDRLFLQLEKADTELIALAKKRLYHTSFAKEAMKHPSALQVINLGPAVNSGGEDYLPYLTADGQKLFFTSLRHGCIGGFNRKLGNYIADIYYSLRDSNGRWQRARNIGSPINTKNNEKAASVSQDGNTMVFAADDRNVSYTGYDLYMVRFNDTTWVYQIGLSDKINTIFLETQPCLAPDNKTLYFVSNRPGGVGGTDIWVTHFENGQWTPPKNLGPPINTPGNEYTPFIHADGVTLYFASDYHLGFGGVDLFMSRKTDTGWTKPRNLGYPINSPEDDKGIYVTPQGTEAYLGCNRKGSYGKKDIYVFTLAPSIRPNPAAIVQGIVLDSLTKQPTAGKITIIDSITKDTVRQCYSQRKTGKFLTTLPLYRHYVMYIEVDGYLLKKLFLENIASDTDLTILLTPNSEKR